MPNSIELPYFLVLDASSEEPEAHPIAAAWSIEEGQIKNTLICPEDDWHDWDPVTEDMTGISQDILEMQGESGLAVIREMVSDLDAKIVYVEDLTRTEELLTKLYDAYDQYPPFELAPVAEVFESLDYDQRLQLQEDICHDLGLNPYRAEEKVHIFLAMAAQLDQQG